MTEVTGWDKLLFAANLLAAIICMYSAGKDFALERYGWMIFDLVVSLLNALGVIGAIAIFFKGENNE